MGWYEIFKQHGMIYLVREVFYRMDWRKPNKTSVKKFLEENVMQAIILKKQGKLPKFEGTNDEIILQILRWVHDRIVYVKDQERFRTPELWLFVKQTLDFGEGDCVAEYEEIYTEEGIKKVKDIVIGEKVLSYDFKKGKFCYNPILKIWDKGVKKIQRVHFRNGQHIDVTENHNFIVRDNQKKIEYVNKKLCDIDLTRWWKRKVPISKQVPYKPKDIGWLNNELCFVLGHYLAEGWKEKSKVQSSGYELIEHIIPILEKHDIPFSEYKNNSGVPCINFLQSGFKEFLKKQKENSFDIHIQEELLILPQPKLKSILDGFFLGDGHLAYYPDKRGYDNNKRYVYSTSSSQLASDIQRIGLQLGKSFHIWKQQDHKGVGNKPIYRITYNPQSHFLKDYGYSYISEVSISYIEELGKIQTYDFEVADTHNFVFKNGVITHNCEDGSVLIYSVARAYSISPAQIRLVTGHVKAEKGVDGHCWVEYLPDEFLDRWEWYTLDWCYDTNTMPFKDRITKSKNYVSTWWTITDF